jgi:hypothetical protein
MKNILRKSVMRGLIAFPVLLIIVIFVQLSPLAQEVRDDALIYLGRVSPGRNTGNPSTEPLGRNDLHFGWEPRELGRFSISGYTEFIDGDVPNFDGSVFAGILKNREQLHLNLEGSNE